MTESEEQQAPAPFPEAVQEQAIANLRALVKGNGIAPGKLEYETLEGGLYPVSGYTRIEVSYTRSQGKAGKKKKKGEYQRLESADALEDAIESRQRELCKEGDKRKQIIQELLETPDQGFNPDGYTLELADFNCSYVLPRACETCNHTGRVTCQSCQGNKTMTCRKCQGSTQTTCPQCQGSTFIQGPNGQQQCQRCSGQGQVNCDQCSSSGFITCPNCGARGTVTCRACGGAGWSEEIVHIAFNATTRLEYNTQDLPRGLVRILHKQAGELAAEQAIALRGEEDTTSTSQTTIYVTYTGTVPYARLHMRLKDKKLPALIYGHDARMDEVPPFLEHICSPGIQALHKAADNSGLAGNVTGDLETAGRYRLLRSALLLTSQHTPRQALQKMSAHYPHGIRQSSLKGLVMKSDKALRNITRIPRLIGLSIGLCLSALFILGYYLYIQDAIPLTVPWQTGLIDTGIVILCALLTSTSIHFMARRTLRRVFAQLTEDSDNTARLRPRLDLSVTTGVSAALGLYGLIIATLTIMSDKAPGWAETAYTMLG